MPTPAGIEFSVVSEIIRLLEGFDPETQSHVLNTVTTWLRLNSPPPTPHSLPASNPPLAGIGFSIREELSPKQFLLEKAPESDTERIACLAYYLTHYRETKQFKTSDLSKLNTEAAQRPFSNAAYSSQNAMRDGFLAPASKSSFRQLSAMGEQYVNALPDREQARLIRQRMTPKRARRGKPNTKAIRRAN